MCEKEKVAVNVESSKLKSLVTMTFTMFILGAFMTWTDVLTGTNSLYRVTVEGILIAFGLLGIYKLKLKRWF